MPKINNLILVLSYPTNLLLRFLSKKKKKKKIYYFLSKKIKYLLLGGTSYGSQSHIYHAQRMIFHQLEKEKE